jgi:hypothetical protein
MTDIKTAGELRTFLTGVLLDIRRGELDVEKANAIAKVSAQINQSLAVEVAAALKLEKMEGSYPLPGTMAIGHKTQAELPVDQGGGIWCDQCEARVTHEEAGGCKSRYCKAKAAL